MNSEKYTTPVANLLSRLDRCVRSGDGWMAPCPAHDDGTASLSISTGHEGRVLVHCFAGCPAESILSALELEWRDLWPEQGQRKKTAHKPAINPLKLESALRHELLILLQVYNQREDARDYRRRREAPHCVIPERREINAVWQRELLAAERLIRGLGVRYGL